MNVAIIGPKIPQALLAALIREGHTIFSSNEFEEEKVTPLSILGGQIDYYFDPITVLQQPLDLAIIPQNPVYYRIALEQNIPVIGCSSLGICIGENSLYANWLVQRETEGLTTLMVPRQHIITNTPEAINLVKHFKKHKKRVHLLKYVTSSKDKARKETTVVPYEHDDLITFFESKDLFKEVNSAFLEEKPPEGVALSFGAWFSGTRFVLPYYVGTQCRGTSNRDRGNVQTDLNTGSLLFHESDTDLRLWGILKNFEEILGNIGYCGIFGLDVVLTSSGTLHFLGATTCLETPTFEGILSSLSTNRVSELLKTVAKGDSSVTTLESLISENFICSICHYSEPSIFLHAQIHGMKDAAKTADLWPIAVKMPSSSSTAAESSSRTRTSWWSSTKLLSSKPGRNFCVNGVGKTLTKAQNVAYGASRKINYYGGTYRDDVGEALRDGRRELLKHNIISKKRFDSII